MSITIEHVGRRHYLTGNTYPIRDAIRAIGAHWDAERKAWWSSKRDEVEALVAKLGDSQPAGEPRKAEAPGMDATVAGRVEYKGKTYYMAGRVERDRNTSHWDEGVCAIETRDGTKALLYFRDGSSQFWAASNMLRVLKTYDRPQTIRGLREYAERAKRAGSQPGERLESGYYYAANGNVLASGCSACRDMGDMCPSCLHDYQ